jgi:TonB-linked SusC/RagA family outer membrane protein
MVRHLLLILAFFGLIPLTCFAQNMAWADSTSPKFQSSGNLMPLDEALDKLSDTYKVYFSYDLKLIQAFRVNAELLSGDKIETTLTSLLKNKGLDYKKVGANNYVIFKLKKNKIGENSLREQEVPMDRIGNTDTRLIQVKPQIEERTTEQQEISEAKKFSVHGVVKDEAGEVLIAATVMAKKNVGTGAVTDVNGNYRVELPDSNDTLVFSYTGYKTKEEPVQGRTEINVSLMSDMQTMDEVVVVGFGTQKKRFTTGSIAKIKGADIQNATQNTVEGALQGRVSGVQVTQSDGMAGSPVTIRIRGVSSIVASSEPLYVVDGVPIVSGNYSKNDASTWRLATAHESNALQQLNPSDIESIEILKDASAAAIYGSRGANGVVLITTKKGKEGKTQFNAGYQSGFSKETNRINLLNGSDYLQLAKEAWTNSYNDALADDDPNNNNAFDISNDYAKFWESILPEGLSREKAEQTNTDWIDYTLRNGFFQEMNLSAAGGNDKTLFYLGGTYRDEKGIFVGNDFKRYNGRINVDHNPTSFLSLGARAAFTVTDNDIIPISWAGGLGMAQSQALPFWPVYNEDGTFFNAQSGRNVAAELANTEMNQKGSSILGNVYAQLKLLRHFTVRAEFGVNNVYKNEFYYRSAVILPDAIATSVLSESTNWNINNTITYAQNFGKHAIDFLAGMNATRNHYLTNIINGENFPNPSLKNPENAAFKTASIGTTQFSFLSFLSRLNYRFNDKYLLSLSVRRDGSSRFGQGNRWGTFPALSLGWIVSEEEFLKNLKTLTFLKLRATYGETGNAEIGNFEYYGSYATNNYVDMPGITVQEIDNPGLGWEATRQYDVGLDFGIWDGRIEGGFDFYLKQTTNLLTEIDVSALSGVTRVTSNIGSLENKGFDFSLTSHNLIGKLKWETSFNFSYNTNVITDLGGRDFIPGQNFGLGAVGLGYPVGARFLVEWAGIASDDMSLSVTDPESGNQYEIQVKGGDELFINQFGELTNIYSPNDQVFYGNLNPKWTGGLTNTFFYQNFDLSVLATFATGHDLSNEEQRYQYGGIGYGWTMLEDGINRWNQPGDIATTQRLTWAASNRNYVSSRTISKADFARLRDVTIGYNFPKILMQKWKIGNIRLYAKGSNLATLTKYKGWDPEYNRDGAGNVGQGSSWLPSPQAKSVSFGLNVTF